MQGSWRPLRRRLHLSNPLQQRKGIGLAILFHGWKSGRLAHLAFGLDRVFRTHPTDQSFIRIGIRHHFGAPDPAVRTHVSDVVTDPRAEQPRHRTFAPRLEPKWRPCFHCLKDEKCCTHSLQKMYSQKSYSGRYSCDSGRFRTCTSSYYDPFSPVGLLFQLPTALSLAGRSP